MPNFLVKSTIQDFANSALLAKKAGYDGVEIMGSEGYLIHQFLSARTNHRKDQWGGTLENRMRFALEIVKNIRTRVGENFIIIFRISLLDLVPGGASADEIIQFAHALEKAGVSILNSGIGWHEARIPTIASMVPTACFSSITGALKKQVKIPVIAVNRINRPEIAEQILKNNEADLISMARPLLADPDFVKKARQNKASLINTCIACNQACLDHIFSNQKASCLVNPLACEEEKWNGLSIKSNSPKKIAIVGSGPAGLASAVAFLQKGHQVTLFEKTNSLGGQFKLASLVPGKSDYQESIRYWKSQIESLGGTIMINHEVETTEELKPFDEIIIAAGIAPRNPKIPGQELPHVYFYDQFLSEKIKPKTKVAIIGSGGIGFDLATYVLNSETQDDVNPDAFMKHWGIEPKNAGGLASQKPKLDLSKKITLLQRSDERFGRRLGKTTGWIHRLELKRHGVKMLSGVQYEKITEYGIWIINKKGTRELIEAEQIVICAGQVSVNALSQKLEAEKIPHQIIGGAKLASEIDAKRAIREGMQLALNDA